MNSNEWISAESYCLPRAKGWARTNPCWVIADGDVVLAAYFSDGAFYDFSGNPIEYVTYYMVIEKPERP